MNLNRPPRSLLPLRCWAVVAAQHPVPSYWSVLCRSPARPGTIINTRPRCLRPRGNGRLVCYYYYQGSLAMTAPLWQRPPRVTLLLSRLACDDCTFVAKTALLDLTIINTRPRCLHPRGNNRLVCYYYYQSSLAMTAPLWQRPPRVTSLLSMLARNVCALVPTTASRAIIINACPGLLRPSGTDCLTC